MQLCSVIAFIIVAHMFDVPISGHTNVQLGSTKVMTLFQPFYPRNVPKRVIGLSSSIKMLFYTATYEFLFFQDFLIKTAEIKCNHSGVGEALLLLVLGGGALLLLRGSVSDVLSFVGLVAPMLYGVA